MRVSAVLSVSELFCRKTLVCLIERNKLVCNKLLGT